VADSWDDERLGPHQTEIRYNVPVDDESDALGEGGHVWCCSEEELSHISFEDAEEAAQLLTDVLGEYFSALGFPAQDDFGNPTYGEDLVRWSGWYRDSPYDRTVESPVLVPEWYTAELIQHLRETFFVSCPLWRIRFTTTIPGRTPQECRPFDLMVYPAITWVGKHQCPPAALTEVLGAWSNWLQGEIDVELVPKRRQFQWVRAEATRLLAEARRRPFQFIGAFDNCRGDASRHCIWFMRPGSFHDYVVKEDWAADGKRYWLTETGEWHRFEMGRGFCVCESIVPASEQHVLTVESVTGETSWRVVIAPDDIQNDANLDSPPDT